MQLTRFDHWLRERFVYETHIQTLRAPAFIPRGIRAKELPDTPGKRFKHLFIVRKNKTADDFIASLRDANLMFSATVVDRKAWFVPLLAPKGKSLTWILAWIVLASTSTFYVVQYLIGLLSDPATREMFAGALEILKG
jgi:hypothetical protein